MSKTPAIKQFYAETARKYLQSDFSLHEATQKTARETNQHFDRSKGHIRKCTKEFRTNRKIDPEAVEEYLGQSTAPVQREHPKGDWVLDGDYHYDPSAETYLIHLSAANDLVTIPKETMEKIWDWYSNWDGDPKTINEICQRIGFPRTWFQELRRKMGLTHDREPYTPETVVEEDTDVLADDLLQKKRRRLAQAKEQSHEDAAEKWWEFQAQTLNPLKDALSEIDLKALDPIDPSETDYIEGENCALWSLADVHFGERGAHSNYTLEDMQNRFYKCAEKLQTRMLKVSTPEKIILAFLGDIFHVDTYEATTTQGTNLPTSDFSKEIKRVGIESAIRFIETMRQHAPLEIICVSGNHDHGYSYSMQVALYHLYKDVEHVSVSDEPHDVRFTSYGDNLFGFAHGDQINKTDLPGLMARERPKLWGRTTNREYHLGHHHKEEMEYPDISNVQLVWNPAVSPQSRYEWENGWASPRGMNCYIYHPEEGRIHLPSVRIPA